MGAFRRQLYQLAFLFTCTLASNAYGEISGQDYLSALDVSESDVKELESGAILAYSDAEYESTERELSADAIILVNSDLDRVSTILEETATLIPDKYIISFTDIRGEADFDVVAFDSSDLDYKEVKRLMGAHKGKEFNFSADEYALIAEKLGGLKRATRAEQTNAATDVMREILLGRYRQYRESGIGGIASYQRSSRRQVNIGEELLMTTETFAPAADQFPEFLGLMKNYPTGEECCENYFRLLKVEVRNRPTFVLSHRIIQRTDDFILFTERYFYVTHTLNGVQIIMSWLPYGEDTYVGAAMSASADILHSMLGKMLRPLGRNKAKELVSETLEDMRTYLESGEAGQ